MWTKTIYAWRKTLGLTRGEHERLQQLEAENRSLKRPLADLSLDKDMLQEVLRK